MREFYTQKAAECLLASQQVHRLADKNALLHMAATYIDLATQIELGEERGYDVPERHPPSQSPEFQIETRTRFRNLAQAGETIFGKLGLVAEASR